MAPTGGCRRWKVSVHENPARELIFRFPRRRRGFPPLPRARTGPAGASRGALGVGRSGDGRALEYLFLDRGGGPLAGSPAVDRLSRARLVVRLLACVSDRGGVAPLPRGRGPHQQ